MKAFNTVESIAAPMPGPNIDTDQIVPKQFLKIIRRTGLGDRLFFDWRFDDSGRPIDDFVLNQPVYRNAQILVAGDNFGCGSSREHAIWALMDFGICCVISTSFSDIFANNAVKNGLLAAVVSKDDHAGLLHHVTENRGARFVVELENQTIAAAGGPTVQFSIDPYSKTRLLQGLDEIELTLKYSDDIAAYEIARAQRDGWFVPG